VGSAASGGASVAASSYASLERTLDRTIECLIAGPQSREARALLIEARRLRSVIANWRSIPPPGEVHDEMLERVLHLSTAVGAAYPESADELTSPGTSAAPPDPRPHGGAPLNPPVEGSEAGAPPSDSYDEEVTEGYALDFEPRLYSLDTATSRQAVPPPLAAEAPAHRAAVAIRAALDRAPISEEEPTQAWSNAALLAHGDVEQIASAPAPWPVEEPPHLPPVVTARTSVPPPALIPTRPSTPPPPIQAALEEGASQPVLRGLAIPSRRPPPDDEAAAVHIPPKIVTYEFDAEGDDLSVPRTQIAAHAVKLSDPVNPLLVVLTDPYSSRADAYRTLRRKLAATPAARVLAVTSAQAGEGKTVFALNLALTLRESARSRVLVVEANLRAPLMATMLGFSSPECFLAQLSRHAEDPRAPWVVAEPLPKLHVMAIDPQLPHEPLLDPVTFSMGLERLKQAGYEYIIVDSPAVLGSTDCNVISDAVDALILTALPMKSMRKQMRKAVEQLEPAPILGVVVLEV
jgi:Mrp family chromosome partitioning ATPase